MKARPVRTPHHPELLAVADALCGRSSGSRKDSPARVDWRALHDCRRDAGRAVALRSVRRWPRRRVHGRRSVLDPADLHARAEIRQRPHPLWLLPHRAAPAGRHGGTGAGTARRAPCSQRRAVPAVSLRRARDVYRGHAAPGSAHPQRAANAVSALGRRRVRAADRRHQHREPVAGASQRPATRAGHAARPRRAAIPCRPPAPDRGRRPRRSRRSAGTRARRGHSARPRLGRHGHPAERGGSRHGRGDHHLRSRGLGDRGDADRPGAGDGRGRGDHQPGSR